MATVSDILRSKGAEIHSVPPSTTAHEAIEIMSGKNIGSVMVTEGDKVLGIFTERDFLRRVALEGRGARSTPVREVMTEKIVYAEPDDDTTDALAIMIECHLRHMPVLEDGRLGGLISIQDLAILSTGRRKAEPKYILAGSGEDMKPEGKSKTVEA